jgi:hypothetical protein
MKRMIFAAFALAPHFLMAQAIPVYESLDKLGWKLINFEQPEKITELDSGRITYLITLNKNGYVKEVEIISNTFRESAEKDWIKIVERFTFEQQNPPEQPRRKYKGTLLIESMASRNY